MHDGENKRRRRVGGEDGRRESEARGSLLMCFPFPEWGIRVDGGSEAGSAAWRD